MEPKNRLILSEFGISPIRGFLPHEDPITSLPKEWSFLDEVGNNLPELIANGTLVHEIRQFPISSDKSFQNLDKRELMLAWVRYCFILNAFVHSQKATSIPQNLAKPVFALSKIMGTPPILSYYAYTLNNWVKKDPTDSVNVDNLELIQTFIRDKDQDWFILTHVDIENEAGMAIYNVVKAYNASESESAGKAGEALLGINTSLKYVIAAMKKMPEGTSPNTYHKIRPWIMSFENVTYEGVEEYFGQPQSFRGQTGAQTSVFQSLEAGLGTPQLSENKLAVHLKDMRNYMLPKHREFIEYLEKNSRVRDFVKTSAPHLIDLYDECAMNILIFLAIHLGYAFFYIHQKTNNPKGTGGTDFMDYLGERIKERWQRVLIRPRTENDFNVFMTDVRKTVKDLLTA